MLNDSNTNWLGNIPAEWSIGRIGQLYSERRVKVSDTEYMPLSVTMKGVVPQLSTAAKTDAHDDRKLVRKGDFAINSRSDRRGSCGISEYDGSVSLINTILAPRKSMSPRYYNWLFHTSEFAAEFYKWGHGIVDDLWTTNWNDMKRILVPVPSLLEQERIADFVDRKCADIDNILEKTRASIEEYRKLKQSVITKTIYHEDCSLSKLKYYGSFVNGYAFKSDSFKDAGTRVIKIANIQTGTLSWEDESFVDNSLYDQLTSFQVHKGDVVFALTRPIISGGIKTAIVDTKEKLLLNQRNAMFIGSKSLNNRYLYYTMQSQPFIKEFKLRIDLTGLQPNISTNSIANIAIPYRTILEQDSVVSYLDRKCAEIDSLINNKEKFIVELEAYRKSLIYEYVTGKKEVVS